MGRTAAAAGLSEEISLSGISGFTVALAVFPSKISNVMRHIF